MTKSTDLSQRTFFKIFTYDFRSPLQRGEPIWDGSVPFELPTVNLDTSNAECAEGWNFVDDLAKGFKIAGIWPTGRPSQVAIIEPSKDAIRRGDKWRSSGGKIVRFAKQSEIAKGVEEFSKVFGEHASDMANEQLKWRYALGRPEHNEKTVVEALEEALAARSLNWKVKRYGAAWAARDAWAAGAARAAWAAGAARAAWAARDAWAAGAAWAARDAWAAGAARDAWAAWDALTLFYASKQKWIGHDPMLLTTGLRDAYINGLEIALPTEKETLGYAMSEKP